MALFKKTAEMLAPPPPLATTATRRAPTGLDQGARRAILNALPGAEINYLGLVKSFLADQAYADAEDYLGAVTEVWGAEAATRMTASAQTYASRYTDQTRLNWEAAEEEAALAYGPLGFLLAMPETDFLSSVEAAIARLSSPYDRAGRIALVINAICQRRGVPYQLRGLPSRFIWTGDAEIERTALTPARAALDDPRFRDGPKTDFDQAQVELRTGTPAARKQAVTEACSAVESAMKVVLDERGIARPSKATAQPLFELLRDNGVVAKETQELVLAASRFGNNRARHGPGKVAHFVTEAEAEAAVAAAAVAITFLARQLP